MVLHGLFTTKKIVVSLPSFKSRCLTKTVSLVKKSILLIALFVTIIVSCSDHHSCKNPKEDFVSDDLESNRARGKSVAVTDFNSTDYFIYKGEPMGFNYELLNSFSDYIENDLEFNPDNYPEHLFGIARKISRYDNMIRHFSVIINWDWRLLASLICQESHFNPTVESYAGAFGLMQIMPETGRNFGIDITSSPENNLKAGISYINWLHSIFDPRIPDKKERINFILAAYNAGPGHVLDAMKLTEKNGMNPQKWEGNVAKWLLKKSEPQYYNDTVVKNGYFRGIESVSFVSQIQERFEHYKNIIPEEKSRPF
jgi:membrane-bound lytic murein transglycosylase MltF